MEQVRNNNSKSRSEFNNKSKKGTVTVIGGNITRIITITQSAGQPFLTVSPSDTSVNNNSGNVVLRVNSNRGWRASDTSSWLSENPSNGTGPGKITVKVEQNLTISQRKGTVTVTGGNITRIITITQSAGQPFLTVSPSDTSVNNNSGNVVLRVNSNRGWRASDTSSWLSENPSNGTGPGKITVKVEQNLTISQRKGTVTVTGGNITRIITITQSVGQPFLIVSPSDTSVNNNSGNVMLKVNSNIGWSTSDTSSWLSENPSNGTGFWNINSKSRAEFNNKNKIWNSNSNQREYNRIITITQSVGQPFLIVSPSDTSVSNNSGNVVLTINSNINWSASNTSSWLTENPASGTGNGTITVNIDQNLTSSQRKGVVTITGGSITRTVNITQSAAPVSLNVEPTVQSISYKSGSISFNITSNTIWNVGNNNNLVTVDPDSGSNNKTLRVFYNENITTDQRIGIINISSSEIIRTIKITQSIKPSITVTAPNITNSGENILLNISPPQNFNSIIKELYYRKGGEISYNKLDILDTTGSFNDAFIPADSSTERGIQYYIKFSDGNDSVTYPANDPINYPASIQVSIKNIAYGDNLISSSYSMITIPLNISDPQLSSVLEDDYNSYDIYKWRVFRWDPGSNTYLEYKNIKSNFQPGIGFWLITKDGKNFNINNANSVQIDSAFTIILQHGLNQIGNPYAFKIAWNDIVNSNLVEAPIGYNPNTKDYDDGLITNILNPWQGYFVRNNSPDPITLKIPPVEAPPNLKRMFLRKLVMTVLLFK